MTNKFKVSGDIVSPFAPIIFRHNLCEKMAWSNKEKKSVPNPEGTYSVTQLFDPSNKEHKKFIDKLEELNQKAYELGDPDNKIKTLYKTSEKSKSVPEGMRAYTWTQAGDRSPTVKDMQKNELPDSIVNEMSSGSNIRVVLFYKEIDANGWGGIKLYLRTVQVKDLQKFGSDDNLLDDDDDGFVLDESVTNSDLSDEDFI